MPRGRGRRAEPFAKSDLRLRLRHRPTRRCAPPARRPRAPTGGR
jgi:hypothetical protein